VGELDQLMTHASGAAQQQPTYAERKPSPPLSPEVCTVQVELPQNRGAQTFNEVFLDTTGGRRETIDELVLCQKLDDLSESG